MLQKFLRIISIAGHELYEIMHDHGVLTFILLLPLAYPLVYGFIYHTEVMMDVPTAVVDDSKSRIARDFAHRLDATQGVKVVQLCTAMDEAEELMRQMKVFAIVHIPESFERDIHGERQTRIGLYINMASSLYYKSVALAANMTVLDMNKDISINYLGAGTKQQNKVMRQPVRYYYTPLYNTQSGFAAFIMPPVLMLILQQTLLLGIGMSMGRARETYRRNMHTLHQLYQHPVEIIIGKGIPYFALYLIMAVYMFTFVTRFFGLPSLGDYLTYLVVIVPYLLACIFMGTVLSCLVYRREDCIMIFVSLSVPMLFVSGVIWPASHEPAFWRYVSYCLPSTFGMHAYVRIQGMGSSFADVYPEFRALWIQTAVYFFIAYLLYRWRLSLIKKKLITLFEGDYENERLLI